MCHGAQLRNKFLILKNNSFVRVTETKACLQECIIGDRQNPYICCKNNMDFSHTENTREARCNSPDSKDGDRGSGGQGQPYLLAEYEANLGSEGERGGRKGGRETRR